MNAIMLWPALLGILPHVVGATKPGESCTKGEPTQSRTIELARTVPTKRKVNVEHTFECSANEDVTTDGTKSGTMTWQVTKCRSVSNGKEMTPKDPPKFMMLVCVKCNLEAAPEVLPADECPDKAEIAKISSEMSKTFDQAKQKQTALAEASKASDAKVSTTQKEAKKKTEAERKQEHRLLEYVVKYHYSP